MANAAKVKASELAKQLREVANLLNGANAAAENVNKPENEPAPAPAGANVKKANNKPAPAPATANVNKAEPAPASENVKKAEPAPASANVKKAEPAPATATDMTKKFNKSLPEENQQLMKAFGEVKGGARRLRKKSRKAKKSIKAKKTRKAKKSRKQRSRR